MKTSIIFKHNYTLKKFHLLLKCIVCLVFKCCIQSRLVYIFYRKKKIVLKTPIYFVRFVIKFCFKSEPVYIIYR